MGQGGILHLQLENKGKEYVMISVIDNGHGIKQENLPVLQRPFIQRNKIKLVWD